MESCYTLSMNLKDKVVVITGSSRGLGEALAREFSEEKARVVISCIKVNDLKKLAKKVDAFPIVADVTKEIAIRKVAQTVIKKYGRIDIWINNAGVWLPYMLAEKLNMKRVQKLFAVNVFGLIMGSQAALKQMKKQRSGSIINIISISALSGRPKSSAYCASKFAADGFTKSIRMENKTIRVVGVYPGKMKTHLFDESKQFDFHTFMDPTYVAQKIVENLKKKSPKDELIIRK